MKPSIPKGTRDFTPDEMVRRNYIFDTIKNVYQKYGFQQIETPAMEMLSTLEGKYGEEGDKLLFRILNSGDAFGDIKTKHPDEKISDFGFRISDFSEKGLRYDLTVPFARYVVMHQNEITFPFKRFQIQPVWRADRPQKGRYREFYQCDADVIGSDSLLNEVELIQMIDDVFSQLGIHVVIKINNRKILLALAERFNLTNKFFEFVAFLDKLEKPNSILDLRYSQGVNELTQKINLSEEDSKEIMRVIYVADDGDKAGSNLDKFDFLKKMFQNNLIGNNGLGELDFILKEFIKLKVEGNNSKWFSSSLKNSEIELDISLARGLNYYTGTIIEVKVNDKRSTFTSSICGGGRYDDLTGIFGLPNVSGVGISFGADRIYDVLEEMNGFPDFSNVSTKILFVNFGEAEAKHCMQLAKHLRDEGINTELFPDTAKMKKQMSYADAKKIPYVALIGSEEMKTGEITIKNMSSGEQSKVTMDELLHILK